MGFYSNKVMSTHCETISKKFKVILPLSKEKFYNLPIEAGKYAMKLSYVELSDSKLLFKHPGQYNME